ncbi:MAG: c-type cytochrome [Deltaproteobacteria bacterium]|nr:c-type cytochrome [Deltaproteobacteria bacterium]
MKHPIILAALLAFAFSGLNACSKKEEAAVPEAPQLSKGVGPVTSVALGPVDAARAAKGKQLFESKCAACHKLDEKYVGPAIKGVTQRRSPEWIMNMIMNPQEMTEKDPTARELLATYFTQMTFQNVTQDEARDILEYFRKTDE